MKTYAITGAASGIGRATTAQLRSEGHRVIGVDLNESDADVIAVPPFGTAEVYLPLAGLIDKEARRAEIGKKLEKLGGRIEQLEGRLSNEKFVNKAPEKVVQDERDRLAGFKTQLKQLEDHLLSMA